MDNFYYFYMGILFLFKATGLLIGYLIVRLGFDLMVKGIRGEFKFSSSYKGFKGGLISSSPGLLFLLLGVFVITVALFHEREFGEGTMEFMQSGPPEKPLLLDSLQLDMNHF